MPGEEKMKNEELEQVAGGRVDNQHIKEISKNLLDEHGKNCKECGKRFLNPNKVHPAAYGDLSLCPECNTKKGLGWNGKKQKMHDVFLGDREKD